MLISEHLPSGKGSSTEGLVEHIQALEVLAGEPSQDATLSVASTLIGEEGRPKKGKPLPRGKL